LKSALRFLLLSILWVARVSFAGEPTSFHDADASARRVFELVDERLSLMEPVAAWKWQHHQPVTDAAREAQVLDSTADRAARFGFDRNAVRHLFEVQIGWARAIEERAVAKWDAHGFDRAMPARDLTTELRPALDRIGTELLTELYLSTPALNAKDFGARYRELAAQVEKRYGLPAKAADELLASLHDLQFVRHATLDRVEASHILRVALTGDYAPFSVEREGSLRGADVDLARELGRKLNAEVRFVKTSWSTLLADYDADRFDIAMGGISVTPERSSRAAFSVSYHSGGKTAMGRCVDSARFATLDAIDRPDVRVIVNPGGTNEKFDREHLKQAQLAVFQDNRAIFTELVASHADVMITDDVEVELQTRVHPELCRLVPGTFDKSEKAYLLPRDDLEFITRVNDWLKAAIADGQVNAAFERALVPSH
jgi:cyclohexadienyl dehydratase